MKTLLNALLLTFTMLLSFMQLAGQSQSAHAPESPENLVRSLYTQVISRHPIGVTKGFDMTTFAPFLSNSLRHRIDLTIACEADYFHQYPETDMKPYFGWLELGLFSGDGENAGQSDFKIERKKILKDGTVRIYLTLIHPESNERPWTWQVAAVARREGSHYVVDDVIYLKDKTNRTDVRLSNLLSKGCKGSHWIGESSQR